MSSSEYRWYPPYKKDSLFSQKLLTYRDLISKMAWIKCSIAVRLGDLLPHNNSWMFPLVVVEYDYDTRSNLPEYHSIGLPPSAYIKYWVDKPEWLKDWDTLKDIIHVAKIAKSDRSELAEVGYYMSMCASLKALMSIIGKDTQMPEREEADSILSVLDAEIETMVKKIHALYRMDVLGEY